MRQVLPFLSILALVCAPSLLGAQGPERPPPLFSPDVQAQPHGGPWTGGPVASASTFGPALIGSAVDVLPIHAEVAMPSPSSGRVLLGSALGTVAGAAVGAGLALLVYSTGDRLDGHMFPGLGEAVLIGLPVTAAGAWAGTRIASGGRGNPWLTGLAAVGGVGLGVGAGLLVGNATGSEVLAVGVALPIAIVLPAWVEVATAR